MLKKGQTMIELLIATAVIAVGLLSAIGLIYSNMSLVDRDTDDIVAVNLAREGVEFAKQLRDSNWLISDPFDTGLVNPQNVNDFTGTPLWDGTQNGPTIDFTADDMSHPNAEVLKIGNPGIFSNRNAILPNGAATRFRRLLSFHPICVDAQNQTSVIEAPGTCGNLFKAGIRVESRVTWNRSGKARETVVFDDIYDWK